MKEAVDFPPSAVKKNDLYCEECCILEGWSEYFDTDDIMRKTFVESFEENREFRYLPDSW